MRITQDQQTLDNQKIVSGLGGRGKRERDEQKSGSKDQIRVAQEDTRDDKTDRVQTPFPGGGEVRGQEADR